MLLAALYINYTYSQQDHIQSRSAPGIPLSGTFAALPTSLHVPGCEACGQMAVVPAGTFVMGSPENEPGRTGKEGPQHTVTLKSFEIGRTEVTQRQWKAMMGFGFQEFWATLTFSDPKALLKQIKNALTGNNLSGFRACGDACPVENISWDDTQAFLRKLNQQTGLIYRLPTEAEWEYAARSGSSGPFSWGSTITTNQANYNGTFAYNNGEKGPYRQITLRSGTFGANRLGLYDMHGNVWEWVQDCWNIDYVGAPANGSAWSTGDCSQRVMRGGSWIDTPVNLRSAFRTKDTPFVRDHYAGFRLARTLP
jgi:formylglycine-generating enzyme required for sulfatase activity